MASEPRQDRDERGADLDRPGIEAVARPAETRPEPPSQASEALDQLIEASGRVAAPFVRVGWRGARGIGRRLGVNQAIERNLDRALQSDAAERAADRVLGSPATKRVWRKVLDSEEAQLLVERVAEAPEVRSAITSQGVGLLEDVRRNARKGARRLDDGAERVARRVLRRAPRTARPAYAGAATRLLAIGLDALLLNGILLAVSALLTALIDNVFGLGSGDAATIVFGAVAWAGAAALYLSLFWILAERTPGMTFFGLRILTEGGGPVPPRKDVRRLVGMLLAAIPFLLGFKGIIFDERRRGFHDRFAGTAVFYADPEIDPGVDQSGRVTQAALR